MAELDSIASWVVAALAGGGGGKFIFDVVAARVKSRRSKTEGSVLFVNSAGKFAHQVIESHAKLADEFERYRARQAAREARLDDALRRHTVWDEEVRGKLLELGERVPIPPPLYAQVPDEKGS